MSAEPGQCRTSVRSKTLPQGEGDADTCAGREASGPQDLRPPGRRLTLARPQYVRPEGLARPSGLVQRPGAWTQCILSRGWREHLRPSFSDLVGANAIMRPGGGTFLLRTSLHPDLVLQAQLAHLGGPLDSKHRLFCFHRPQRARLMLRSWLAPLQPVRRGLWCSSPQPGTAAPVMCSRPSRLRKCLLGPFH